jgi:hypothetical protein
MEPYKDEVEWTYERPEGDLVVFARSAEEALATIREYGFTITYPEKLKRTSVIKRVPL